MRNLQSLVFLVLPWHGRNLILLFLTSLARPPVTAMTRLIPLTSWRSLMMARSSTDPVWRRCLKCQQRTGKKAGCSLQTEIRNPTFFFENSEVQQPFPNPNPNILDPFPSLKSQWYPARQETAELRLLQRNLCATCPAGSSQTVQLSSVLFLLLQQWDELAFFSSTQLLFHSPVRPAHCLASRLHTKQSVQSQDTDNLPFPSCLFNTGYENYSVSGSVTTSNHSRHLHKNWSSLLLCSFLSLYSHKMISWLQNCSFSDLSALRPVCSFIYIFFWCQHCPKMD